MESDRVTEEVRLRGGQVAVFRPVLEVRAYGHDALDAGGAALLHPRGETAGLESIFRVTMGVQQAHAAIRRAAQERARPQPCLEKAVLPCTLAACTTG
jgi:ribulose 1,5-bisphosphate carboxylase large subunit-like protein